jgi:hypothetical protein
LSAAFCCFPQRESIVQRKLKTQLIASNQAVVLKGAVVAAIVWLMLWAVDVTSHLNRQIAALALVVVNQTCPNHYDD